MSILNHAHLAATQVLRAVAAVIAFTVLTVIAGLVGGLILHISSRENDV